MIFNYSKAENLERALRMLAEAEPPRVLAGGTDLLVNIQEGREQPARVLDIGGLDELRGIREEGSRIIIGALTTHARIVRSPLLREKTLPLVQACAQIGSPQIRARATLGGNLVNASPAADSVPALVALGAFLRLRGSGGEREVPAEEFSTGVKKSLIRPEELLVEIIIPLSPDHPVGFYRKLGQRKALAIAKVSLAVWLARDGKKVRWARIALGAVATTVLRARRVEDYLRDRELTEESLSEAARLVREESRAISDIRSTALYRDEMTGVLLRRGLEELIRI